MMLPTYLDTSSLRQPWRKGSDYPKVELPQLKQHIDLLKPFDSAGVPPRLSFDALLIDCFPFDEDSDI
jgi:hypothetical protein